MIDPHVDLTGSFDFVVVGAKKRSVLAVTLPRLSNAPDSAKLSCRLVEFRGPCQRVWGVSV